MVNVVAAAVSMPVLPDLKSGNARIRKTGEIVSWRGRSAPLPVRKAIRKGTSTHFARARPTAKSIQAGMNAVLSVRRRPHGEAPETHTPTRMPKVTRLGSPQKQGTGSAL